MGAAFITGDNQNLVAANSTLAEFSNVCEKNAILSLQAYTCEIWYSSQF